MIRKANLNDVDGILDIVIQIVVDMKVSNNTQWEENYPKAEKFK